MTADRWQRIQQVFHAAAACDGEAREAVLTAETSGDDDLRREVEKMLRHAFSSGPLDRPAWDGSASPFDDGLKAGSLLGPYELIEEAGSGGMGRVYKARDTRLGRTVAIKVLSAEFSHRSQAEARAISALNHPHVCALYDIGEQEGVAYLVMEWVEGESLAARLADGALALDEVLSYGSQIADALAAAHRLGIVHRDLKPANIMITALGVKVLDFGVARMAEETAAGPEEADPPVMGTLAYMSPSQLNGNPSDPRSDIFSLGLVLFEMMTGRRAFAGRDRGSMPLRIDAPAPLAKLIRDCLREDARERPQHMEEVRFALERMRSRPGAADRRRMQAGWLTALMVTLAAGTALWKLTPRGVPVPVVIQAQPPAVARSISSPLAPAPRPVENVPETRKTPALPMSLARWTSYRGFVRDASFSPDGSRIAFSWATGGHPGYGIYVRPVADDGEPRRLTPGDVQDYGPAWSPDGRTIAFRRAVGKDCGIYTVPVSGGAAVLLAPIAKQEYQTLPQMSWSPNGKWIAAPDRPGTGGTQIYLFPDGDGYKRKITTNTSGTDHAPSFSPDGKSVAYASCKSGSSNCDVWIADLGADLLPVRQRRITRDGTFIRGVAWSADGRSLVYSAGSDDSATWLWRVRVNPPGVPERIELAGSRARHPAIAGAGRLLVFTDFNPGNWHLMLIENFL